jgi:hypothetical protein
MRRIGVAITVALVALAGPAKPAWAGGPYDFCITCTAPSATYLCTVGAREPDPGEAAWGHYCVERVRHEADHRSCSAAALSGQCQARRAFVFRGASATQRQADALASEEPERRRSAAAEIWQETIRGAGAVGRAVGQGAEAVGEGATTVGETVLDGFGTMGRGIARGAECVWTFGSRC